MQERTVTMSTPTTIPGTVRPESDCPPGSVLVALHYRRTFVRPRSAVWAALTDPRQLSRWYGTFTGDPATGKVQLTMVDDHDRTVTEVHVLRCTPPSSFSVDIDGWLLEVTLHAVGPVTTLDFTHRHVPRSEAAEIGPGWQYYLDRLEAVLSGAQTPTWGDYPDLADEYR